MNKHIHIAGLLFLALAAFSCSSESGNTVAPAPAGTFEKVDSRVLAANNTFGLHLFRTMYLAGGGDNLFMSPLSVSMALGMTMNGAKGETRAAMEATLALQGLTESEINDNYRLVLDLLPALDPGVDIAVANSIWSRLGYPVLPEFLDANRKYFDATAQELDFERPDAADIINGWVYDKTNGRIDKLVKNPIPSYVVMYLINAVYFKAPWTVTFDSKLTKTGQFAPFASAQQQTDYMHRLDSIPYYDGGSFAAADLRYGNGAYAMTVMLPHETGAAALASVIEGLTPESWHTMTEGFSEQKVDLAMPKFTHEYEMKLNDVLIAMGMGIAFEPGRADLSGISAAEALFISEVRHKSFVQVNEQGTEAAAATSVEIGRTSVDPDLNVLLLNRPFIYVIRERETGTILFMGVYQKPV